MNKEKIAIMVDSGCDIPKSFIQKHNIKVLPFSINYPEKSYHDSIDIDPMMIYDRFPEFPKTSTPTLQTIYDTIDEIRAEGYEKLVGIFVSERLTSTVNAVRTALTDHADFPNFVIDTKNISVGAGLVAMWAVERLEAGMGYAELCTKLPRVCKHSKVYFYMDTLEYLRKGGRIGSVTSFVGSMLKIKPIISCDDDGVYYTVDKIRGNKAGISRLIELAKQAAGNAPCMLAVMNGKAVEVAKEAERTVKKTISDGRIVATGQISAALALNTGPGLLGIGVLPDPDFA